MFSSKQDDKATEPVTFTIRVRGVSASTAQKATQGLSSAYQASAAGLSKGLYATRVWAAPQLENAANYHATTIAPAVNSALIATAKQVRPVDMTKKKSPSMLTWSVLTAAILATAGAVAALVRYRYRAAMAADEEDEFEATTMTTTGQASAESTAPTTAGATTTSDTGVNGRVSTSGW